MRKFLIRRLLMMIPLLLGISILSFLIMHLAPGEPAALDVAMNTKVDPSYIQKLQAFYEIDKPLHIQYWHWLKRLATLDFGLSFKDNRPVLRVILERLPATLVLSGLSEILLFLIAVPLGIMAAYYQNSLYDRFVTVFSFIGYSTPAFWISLLLMLLFGVQWGVLPVSGMFGNDADFLPWYGKLWDFAQHLILPLCVTTYGGLASISRYARTSMLEVIRQDYIRTARAKGLSEFNVIFHHALPNALIPIVTLVGLSLPGFIGGSVIIESIFSWPGMGRLSYEAILSHNYPLIMGTVIIVALLTILGNLLADISYSLLDPRIKYD
jgi:peptide/nickel transport system permease protein